MPFTFQYVATLRTAVRPKTNTNISPTILLEIRKSDARTAFGTLNYSSSKNSIASSFDETSCLKTPLAMMPMPMSADAYDVASRTHTIATTTHYLYNSSTAGHSLHIRQPL